MSASLVRKSLQIVDPISESGSKKRKGKTKEIFGLVPENHKLIINSYIKGRKASVNLLPVESKLTVSEARKKIKSKEQILKENLRKLEIIKKASKVKLDKEEIKQIINRAVTKRPVQKPKKIKKKDKQTLFTEEDFKRFEQEYFDE